MKPAPWILAGILLGAIPPAHAQEAGSDRPAKAEGSIQARLSAPIDYWGKGTPAANPKAEILAPEVGPAKIQVRETVWAQPIRTPDGSWMLYVPPKAILDFLEDPSEGTANAYLAWKSEQAEKMVRAMAILGRVKEATSTPAKSEKGTPEAGSDEGRG